MPRTTRAKTQGPGLVKAPTGIQGVDEITGGGLPRGRPTLVCGGPGCGKTLLAMEFLVRGATQYGEPGVFMAFEETAEELTQNVRSFGFDLERLAAQKKLLVDFVRVERSEIDEAGEYDLEGLFVRLGHAIATTGARRVVLDTIETLFSGFTNLGILRAELRRLFRWLKDKGVTAIVTGERGEGKLTRHGLEEYVSDCVILLDHRVNDQISTRRLRVVKYRGGGHGTNEYPFLIDADGISVLPITSLGLRHSVTNERLSTGIPRLDAMLGGNGYFRGSSILVSGTAGTGKTSMAASLVHAACSRGERCLYIAFEESPEQVMRNMRSIGLDLQPLVKKGLLRFHSVRAAEYGLETHLATVHKLVRELAPRIVVMDPIDGIVQSGTSLDSAGMLTRLIDFLKAQGITALLTNLVHSRQEQSGIDISSLVDTWIYLRDLELGGERNRALYVLKSRGMNHSNQIREFMLTDRGIELRDAYLGPQGVLTGSARLTQEANERSAVVLAQQEIERRQREAERKREALEARIDAMRKEFAAEEEEATRLISQGIERASVVRADRERMAVSRHADNSDGRATSRRRTGGRK